MEYQYFDFLDLISSFYYQVDTKWSTCTSLESYSDNISNSDFNRRIEKMTDGTPSLKYYTFGWFMIRS